MILIDCRSNLRKGLARSCGIRNRVAFDYDKEQSSYFNFCENKSSEKSGFVSRNMDIAPESFFFHLGCSNFSSKVESLGQFRTSALLPIFSCFIFFFERFKSIAFVLCTHNSLFMLFSCTYPSQDRTIFVNLRTPLQLNLNKITPRTLFCLF